MTCELISVGTEILLGDIVNTNAAYLSKRLADLGIDVMFQHTVGDNAQRLKDTLELAFSKSDTVITTGGLGPTADDITKEICAEYFDLELYEDKKSLENMQTYFKNKNILMPESNKKQALIPKGAIVLENNCGTAPGCIMNKDNKTIIVLPGPPSEMTEMFEKSVVPYLSKFTQGVIKSHSVRTFGIGESAMAQLVSDLLFMKNPTVAPYAKSGEALLRVTAKAQNDKEAQKLMLPVIDEIKARLGSFVYDIDSASIEETTVSLLKEKKLTVSCAESCTAGLVSKRLTDIAGSSCVLKGSVVSYTDEVKRKVLSVSKQTLEKYTAVSEKVACQMALGVLKLTNSDLALSVTGVAGPGSDENGNPVGLIYIAVTDGKLVKIKKLQTGHDKGNCRDYNRTVGASNAINELRLFALGQTDKAEAITAYLN